MSNMKYGEDDFLAEGLEYIKKTYGEHYANPEAQGFQLFDMWDSQGTLLTTARDTAQKYLARFGKKDGFNKKDLLKALHYIVLMNYAARAEFQPKEDPAKDTDTLPPLNGTMSEASQRKWTSDKRAHSSLLFGNNYTG